MKKRLRRQKYKVPKYREPYGLGNIVIYAVILGMFIVGGIKTGFTKHNILMLAVLIGVLIFSIIRHFLQKPNPLAKENYEKFKAMIEEDDNFDYDLYDDMFDDDGNFVREDGSSVDFDNSTVDEEE